MILEPAETEPEHQAVKGFLTQLKKLEEEIAKKKFESEALLKVLNDFCESHPCKVTPEVVQNLKAILTHHKCVVSTTWSQIRSTLNSAVRMAGEDASQLLGQNSTLKTLVKPKEHNIFRHLLDEQHSVVALQIHALADVYRVKLAHQFNRELTEPSLTAQECTTSAGETLIDVPFTREKEKSLTPNMSAKLAYLLRPKDQKQGQRGSGVVKLFEVFEDGNLNAGKENYIREHMAELLRAAKHNNTKEFKLTPKAQGALKIYEDLEKNLRKSPKKPLKKSPKKPLKKSLQKDLQ
ncbi:MAG: hypothetical protein QM752_00555 [Gammaproteobacteria bacterium]